MGDHDRTTGCDVCLCVDRDIALGLILSTSKHRLLNARHKRLECTLQPSRHTALSRLTRKR
ncbi:hypothetical protein AMATHDRAFT_66399 [Amanita thiersii Skay4041]|uniref:Uncharacterized protein n=1 Tax=Amanita thiersii Skay4041 TaxID=703135 RepID=A0A2A9NJR4_9AGAR|nr:hypothetical protein AMATHDRAFT_66399 [Amanita thiersii Skay4041]